MADPLSITGLVIELGSILKGLYEYGKKVKGAQSQIASLCSELAALQSILTDLEGSMPDLAQAEFTTMRSMATALVNGLTARLEIKSDGFRRHIQSLKFPFQEDSLKETLSQIERIKTWCLLALMSDEHTTIRSLQADLNVLTSLVQDDVRDRRARQDDKENQNLRNLLAPVSPDNIHRQTCQSWQHSGPSPWFIGDVISNWLMDSGPEGQVMVLVGKSGAGKSTLMSQAIEKCKKVAQTDDSFRCAYFYCSYNNTASQEVRNISGSLVAQVSLEQPELLERFKPLAKEDPDILIDAAEQALREAQGIIVLIIDAVNESSEAEKVWNFLSHLTDGTKNIKCLISTTTTPQDVGFKYRQVSMQAELVTPDIELYIQAKCSEHRILRSVPKEDILRALVPRADGMFRWVDCQMTVLMAQRTPERVRNKLQDLPGNINETYASILSHVLSDDQELVREALCWLSYSGRPLKLRELCEAIVFEETQTSIDDSYRLYPQHILVELCQGLVVWDSLTDTITLAHSSIRTFLTGPEIRSMKCSYFALNRQESLCKIVRKCLTYLMMHHFELPRQSRVELHQLKESFPLLEYSCKMWATQAKIVQRHLDESELRLIDDFFGTQRLADDASNFRLWVNMLTLDADPRVVRKAEPLYYAASFGLEVYIERLFTKNLISKTKPISDASGDGTWYIDHKCGRNWSTALQVACLRGSARIVEMLLEEGADPNNRDANGYSCLFWAKRRRRKEIPNLLIAYGADLARGDKKLVDLPDIEYTDYEFLRQEYERLEAGTQHCT